MVDIAVTGMPRLAERQRAEHRLDPSLPGQGRRLPRGQAHARCRPSAAAPAAGRRGLLSVSGGRVGDAALVGRPAGRSGDAARQGPEPPLRGERARRPRHPRRRHLQLLAGGRPGEPAARLCRRPHAAGGMPRRRRRRRPLPALQRPLRRRAQGRRRQSSSATAIRASSRDRPRWPGAMPRSPGTMSTSASGRRSRSASRCG